MRVEALLGELRRVDRLFVNVGFGGQSLRHSPARVSVDPIWQAT